MGNQKTETEENWHGSEMLSTQLRKTDFELQSEAARQLEWITNGRWNSKESLFQYPDIVIDTPVTVTNKERSKQRKK